MDNSSIDKFIRKKSIVLVIISLLALTLFPVWPAEGADDEIDLFAPDGGENIISGSTARIRWTINRAGGYVSMVLSIDGGESWEGIESIENHPSHGQGWYDWFVPPNINSTACRMKVIWTSSLTEPWTLYGEDISQANFTIAPGFLIVFDKYPTTLSYAKYHLFTWTMFDPNKRVDHLRFTWRLNLGSGYGGWSPLPGDYSNYDPSIGWIWWMPPYYESAFTEIRVEAIERTSGAVLGVDITDTISIASPTITLIYPDGGSVFVGGTTVTIEWRTSADPEHVIVDIWVEYSTNGGTSWNTIAWSPDDYEQDWTVPTSVDSSNVIVRVTAEWGEWYYLDDDRSSTPNRIISDPNTLTVSLLQPNPPVDMGVVLASDRTYLIAWTTTGQNTDIGHFKLYYSTDSGSNWNFIIIVATATVRSYTWNVPEVDSYTARVRVELVPQSGPSIFAMSNHDFCIFDTIAYNWPPIAMAGPDQTVNEDTIVYLDGSGSYDPNYETLSYTWTKVSPVSIDVTLSNPSTAYPFFSMSLTSFPVTFVFDLTVSDGIVHTDPILYNTDRVSVTIIPRPPVITKVTPDTGWVGTPITIEGTDLRNAEIIMGGVSMGWVSTDPVPPLSPDPEHSYTFFVTSSVPHGKHSITLRTSMGDVTSTGQVEIFPEPTWQFENAPGFHNPTKSSLSYPWAPWNEGRYKDAFGDDVYLKLWVCIGLPIWTPWTGWYCLGYEIEEPFAPDPLAAIYYGAVFWWMARNGECFGMSNTALRLYHNEIQPNDYGSYYNARDIPNSGEFREHVDYQQGAQMSAEVLNDYLANFIGGLIPSSEYTGLGAWANKVKASIDSGDLGIATMVCGGGAHAVVPYAYEEVDATHTRFYVYDSNREEFSFPDKAIDMCKSGDDHNDNPPYIEVHKSGVYWDWSFRAVDGNLWSSKVGVAFVPWSTVRAHKTMPLSIDGITHLLCGDAGVAIESDNGSRVGYDESGELEFGIPGAAPMPFFSGAGWKAQSWYLPDGNYTATVTGTADGTYNWSAINNGTNAFSIERAEVKASSTDEISIDYPEGNPYRGHMEYGTTDPSKLYTLAQVNRFGNRERVYRIINATLTDSGTHGIGTNDDYSGIKFTNNGNAPTTFDVEFQGNVIWESVWNGTSRPSAPNLPTASRSGITVQPGQTVIIRPTNWLDLDHAVVIIEGESVPGIPQNLKATVDGLNVTLQWEAPSLNGGWPVIGYSVYRGDGPDNMTFLTNVTGLEFYDLSVMNGRTYYYSVRARNVLGLSEAALTVPVTIPALTAPGVPNDLTLSLDPDGVVISWAPPTSDGGGPVTGYVIFRASGAGDLSRLKALDNVLTYIDESVVNGTTYRYSVLAVNSIGEGPKTVEVSINVPVIPGPDDDDDDDDDVDDDDDDKDDFPWWVLILLFIVIAFVIFVILLIVMIIALSRKGPQDEE